MGAYRLGNLETIITNEKRIYWKRLAHLAWRLADARAVAMDLLLYGKQSYRRAAIVDNYLGRIAIGPIHSY